MNSYEDLHNEEYHIEDPATLEQWQVDKYIGIIKENNEAIKKYKDILKHRIQDLEFQYKQKEEKLLKENHYLLTTLGEFAKQQKDLKSTKTQYKYESLTGNIIIKKVLPQPKKPVVEKIGDVEKLYPELVESEIVKKLNWRDLKSKIIIQKGVPYDKETGEDLSRIISIEFSEEEIQIK